MDQSILRGVDKIPFGLPELVRPPAKDKGDNLKEQELVKCIAGNTGTIKAYDSIERKFEELMIPQYSKT